MKSLVDLHGGSVAAHSEGPRRGSRFVVILPRLGESSPDAPMSPPAAGDTRPSPERVLVVDDNVDAAESVADLLAAAGHEVRVAHDAVSAMRELEAFAATVAVLDIGLPAIDGYRLARMISERHGTRAPRMIAVTGYGLSEDRESSRAAGIERHLLKPVSPEELLGALRVPAPTSSI